MKQILKTVWQYGWLILVSLATSAQAEDVRLTLKGNVAIEFSDPIHGKEEKVFGPGWKTVTFLGADGRRTDLIPMEKLTSLGGVIFAGPDYTSVSPTGKYVVLSIVRAGVVDDPDAQSHIGNVATRQYCPVLVARTGCLISIQTGGICGGQWDKQEDLWRGVSDDIRADTAVMLQPEFPSVNELWNEFLKSTASKKWRHELKTALVDNLGVTNLMACEPPTLTNRNAYASIARQLIKEGDLADAVYIQGRLGSAADTSAPPQDLTIVVDRAYLYDLPDIKAHTKMYLVKGDTVRLLDKAGAEWIRIKYVEKNGAVIDKWIQVASIK